MIPAWDDYRPQALGGSAAAPDRQGVLRLLAARGAVLARTSRLTRIPLTIPALFRTDEVDSLMHDMSMDSLDRRRPH